MTAVTEARTRTKAERARASLEAKEARVEEAGSGGVCLPVQ